MLQQQQVEHRQHQQQFQLQLQQALQAERDHWAARLQATNDEWRRKIEDERREAETKLQHAQQLRVGEGPRSEMALTKRLELPCQSCDSLGTPRGRLPVFTLPSQYVLHYRKARRGTSCMRSYSSQGSLPTNSNAFFSPSSSSNSNGAMARRQTGSAKYGNRTWFRTFCLEGT